jgi:hypothetical protein
MPPETFTLRIPSRTRPGLLHEVQLRVAGGEVRSWTCACEDHAFGGPAKRDEPACWHALQAAELVALERSMELGFAPAEPAGDPPLPPADPFDRFDPPAPAPTRCEACGGRGDLTEYGPFGHPLGGYRRCEPCLGTGWTRGEVQVSPPARPRRDREAFAIPAEVIAGPLPAAGPNAGTELARRGRELALALLFRGVAMGVCEELTRLVDAYEADELLAEQALTALVDKLERRYGGVEAPS